jgi:hypothetical protein
VARTLCWSTLTSETPRLRSKLVAFLAGLLALAVVLAVFVGLRWQVATTSGHILFHLDRGEYALAKEIARVGEGPTSRLIKDEHSRVNFAHACMQVGDTGEHLSLALSGLAGHVAMKRLGIPSGTPLLRGLGLSMSTAALLFWFLTLWWRGGSLELALRFATLFVVCPAVWMKLNLVSWGTHEVVVTIAALMFFVGAGWIVKPAPWYVGLVQALICGCVGALMLVLNTALVLPSALFGFAVLVGVTQRTWATSRGGAAAVFLVGAALGAGGLFAAWNKLAATQFLRDLRFSESLFELDKVDQIEGSAITGPAHWASAAALSEPLWLGLIASLVLIGLALRGRLGALEEGPRRLALFCAFWALGGWLIVILMPFAYSEMEGQSPFFVLRYALPLFPPALAAFVFATSLVPRPLGWAFVVALAVFNLPSHLEMVDSKNPTAMARFDGLMPYYAAGETQEPPPHPGQARFGYLDRPFAAGMAIIQWYVHLEYWYWATPEEVAERDHVGQLVGHVRWLEGKNLMPEPGTDAEARFYEGVGYGLSILLPPSRKAALAPLLEGDSPQAESIRAGYDLEDLDVRFNAPRGAGWEVLEQGFGPDGPPTPP